ncbi:hypothetical protein T459_28841 [Capsicum annuum]|uniref:FF domain-containing protein n=1 Tax=Capsicum annuum TaxID=4072 RepID=A0A2G2YHX9_CAPAN|nr:hypothetical protein T459_28841 [Capsicum annuum]
MLVMIVVIVKIVGIVVTVMILAIASGGGGCDVKLVNVSSWSCDSGMVVSTDTVVSVADGGGRGGDTGDSGVVVLVLIVELVGSRDRPVAVDGDGIGGRGVQESIWYLDDKSQIKDAVRMAEIGLTSAWTLDDFKVAIAKYISSLPMSDTNLKFVFEELLERAREKEGKEASKEHAKALEEQKCNRVEYLEFLKSCDFIKASSQWRKVQDRLETDERCSRLEKIDRLEIFQKYIRDLESEEEEQRKLRMMEEHVAAGILNAKPNWRDYCIKIKDFAAYLAISSNTSGS